MPKSISSVVADDGCEDDEDKMPGLEEEWIPPADDLAEQIAIWEAIQAANRWQSSDQEVDKDTSSANDPTPSWDRAGTASDKSSQVESSQVNAKPELSLEVLQTLQNFKFDFSFPKMENSPASSDLGGAHGEAAEESHACENDENEDSSPTEIINTEQEQEQGPVFHLFSQLPEAIRLTIWNLNNPEPRLIEIVEFKKNCRFYGNGRPVVNLQVCHESRIESLKSYPLSFSVDFEEPLIPFCFEKDTLLLGRRLLDEDTHIYFRKHCDLGDLKRVQRLVVDTALCWTTAAEELERAEKDRGSGLQLLRRDRGVGFGGLSRSIFSGVREYTALYNEGTDPLPGECFHTLTFTPTPQLYSFKLIPPHS